MKNFFYMAAIACLALFTSCEKQGVDHTGDDTGKLYGRWVLDTKNVVTEYTSDGKTTTDSEDTNFANDHFFLLLAEPRVAMAKEGTLITFDIDDVDAGTFAYNSELKQITFNKMLRLASGFPVRTMTLYGTYDVVELSNNLVLRKKEEVKLSDRFDASQTTTYSFHRLIEQKQ